MKLTRGERRLWVHRIKSHYRKARTDPRFKPVTLWQVIRGIVAVHLNRIEPWDLLDPDMDDEIAWSNRQSLAVKGWSFAIVDAYDG